MATSAPGLRRIGSVEHRRMPWKNGLGTTDEIAIDPPDAGLAGGTFNWRLSMATVGQSCAFSAFPGYERTIMVIEGDGIELDVAGQPTRRLDRLFEPFVFSGDEPAQCRLIGGAVRDFNLMTARAQWRSRMDVRQIGAATQSFSADGEPVILHCLAGTARVALEQPAVQDSLPAGDTLIVTPRRRPLPLRLAAQDSATVALIMLNRS